jgi:transcription elongation GreA/GreB family factor
LKENLAGSASREKEVEEEVLHVSTASFKRRKAEFDDLVQRQIPENSKEIAVARSYGDLRENHEYKAAKEMQGILMRRQNEMSAELDRARVSDFEDAAGDVAAMGTEVQLQNVDSPEEIRTYHILGAWDSDPARGILSYKTEVGKTILGLPQGSIVELPLSKQEKKKFRILKITPKPATAVDL